MKQLTMLCAMLTVLGFSASAYAEVQNVKVSGEVTVRGIYRSTYDLDDQDGNTSGSANASGLNSEGGGSEASSAGSSESDNFFTSQIRVRVDADLTDNVAAQIEFANQRDWDDESIGGENKDAFDVNVNLANITLKEAFYSPLTLTVGRQDIWMGDGFIIGTKLRDPEASFSADEFSIINNFDAIRATLDYDPITLDLIYVKLNERVTTEEEDADFYMGNVGYQFASYNAEAEAYVVYLKDRLDGLTGAGQSNEIWTFGARGSMEPLANLVLRGEIAGQTGDLGKTGRDRKAWAANVRADYSFQDVAWDPSIAGQIIFYSGEKLAGDDPTGGTGDYEGWDSLLRGNFYSAIREFQGVFYATDDPNDSSGATNMLQFVLDSEFHPMDDVTVSAAYLHYIFDEEPVSGRDDHAGDEIDIVVDYDYTEDVSMQLIAAWFFPGDYYLGGTVADGSAGARSDDQAIEVVGSLSVGF